MEREIKLSIGDIIYHHNSTKINPYVIGQCDNWQSPWSGIPGRSTAAVCIYFETGMGNPPGVKQCIFCRHWQGARIEEVMKALAKNEGIQPPETPEQAEPERPAEPFNRFAHIDIVM
jgi:hypothetical protein